MDVIPGGGSPGGGTKPDMPPKEALNVVIAPEEAGVP